MLHKPKKIQKVYLDHAATTPVSLQVQTAMAPYFSNDFGNPSTIYSIGRKANESINNARKIIAELIHGLPENIIFTGSGSESDNLAIFGIARKHKDKGKHIISLGIEHHAVLEPLKQLEKEGFEISFVKTNKDGLVDSKDVIKAIKQDTILVTVMYANNEVGSIQPIAEIGKGILKYRKLHNTPYPYFHSDACQAAGYLDLDVEKLHLDLMTFNGSKIYAPKGVGVLYLRRGVLICPILFGGGQEKGRRAGTENVPYIIGLAKAFELVQESRKSESDRLRNLSKYFLDKLAIIPNIKLNGPSVGDDRLPNNLNISFKGIEGEALLLYLDEYGIMCSTGSACTSESLEPSHVLRAMGQSFEDAHGSIRFSMGKQTRKVDIDYIIKYLPDIVSQLREISAIR